MKKGVFVPPKRGFLGGRKGGFLISHGLYEWIGWDLFLSYWGLTPSLAKASANASACFVMDRHGEVVGLNSAVENPPHFMKCGGGVALFYWGW